MVNKAKGMNQRISDNVLTVIHFERSNSSGATENTLVVLKSTIFSKFHSMSYSITSRYHYSTAVAGNVVGTLTVDAAAAAEVFFCLSIVQSKT
uniref:Uncharacterized protein n=1 Tax=Arion vulgaris TaxID=1028688 RepID=A0A0B7BS80_9EUPU